MCKYFVATIFVLCCSDLFAQSHSISGYVRDEANGESLIGATIFDRRSGKGTTTNNFGFYSFTVIGDSAILSYSFVGYNSKNISVRVKGDTSMVVLLQGGRVLDEITIQGYQEKIHETSRTGTVNLPVTQIKTIPAFAGEQDVLKALQLLPGVSGGNEGSSNILVRGGSADQTLILMDGVPIYNPTHLYGFFSSFNPDAVNNVELVKSGFPARYGGRLSGIADITLREGNSNRFSAQATAGLLASRILLEGPIIKNRTSFLVSGRASYLTLMRPLLEQKVGQASLEGYKFHDINAKVNHRINANNRIFASLYTGSDRMTSKYSVSTDDSLQNVGRYTRYETYRDRMGWKNLLASLRWNHEISEKNFFNVTAYVSTYDLFIENTYDRHRVFMNGNEDDFGLNYRYNSSIEDVGLKIDFAYIPNTRHYLRYGAGVVRHEFTPAVAAQSSTDTTYSIPSVNSPISTNEASVYLEDDISFTSKFKVNAGVHAALYNVQGKTYTSLQPRLAMRYLLPNNLSVKASYAYMQQFVQTLTNAGLGMPVELWVPTTEKVKPQNSQQFSVGAAQTLNDFEISAEGFYKTMNNLLEYEEGASYLDNKGPWYDKIEIARGKSYGLELFVHKKVGRLTGFAGYTLSWNKRQSDNINNGEWYYYRFDRRHDFKVTLNYKFNNRKWDASATWMFATGSAVTVPVAEAPGAFTGDPSVGLRNDVPEYVYNVFPTFEINKRSNYRMQPYHRLDLNVNYTVAKGKFEHKMSVGLYNAYSRLNPFYIQYDYNRNNYKSVSLFPIMPAASYSIKF